MITDCWIIGLPSGVEFIIKKEDSVEDLPTEWHITLMHDRPGTMVLGDDARFYNSVLQFDDMKPTRDLTVNSGQIAYIRKIILNV